MKFSFFYTTGSFTTQKTLTFTQSWDTYHSKTHNYDSETN